MMPKRKKLPKMPDYEGMGTHSDNAEIQKARPLQSLSETDLTLPEFKILDAYLARINSHDPDKRTVRLEKGELEKALGISEIKQDDLETRLRHLFQVIKVKDERKRKGFKLINLFEEADAEQDDDGLWQITLTCTPSAREYIFNIDNLGYLRYRLKNVINLTSRYSYVLFLYLLDNRFRKMWSIDLADLKALLNCNADTYKQYKYFNDLVLKKCHKELCEKTELRFSYEPVKKSRSVVAVRFTIETNSEVIIEAIDEKQLSLFQENDDLPLWQEPLLPLKLTQEQYDVIGSLLVTIPDYKLPECPACPGALDLRRYHYLDQKVKEINSRGNVKNPYSYLVKIMKNDGKE